MSKKIKKDGLLLKVKEFEKFWKIDIEKDQYFIINQKIIDDLIKIADVKKNESVLEIGTGLGFITFPLAKKAKKVITIEIDQRFKPFLKNLPSNVSLIFGDAYKLFCNEKFIASLGKIDKIIGNIPYRKAENFLHPIIKGDWFFGDLFWITPSSFVNKVNNNPIFSAYFKAKFIKKIPKESFYPQPKTISAIVHFQRIEDPEKTKNYEIFIRRWLYEHENWKLKNALREGIITAGKRIKNQFITKNQAREIIRKIGIEDKDLEKMVSQIKLKLYFKITKKIVDFLI